MYSVANLETLPEIRLGESVRFIDGSTMSTPLGLIHVWEFRHDDRRGRFFVSLDWKVRKTTKNNWLLEMESSWRTEAGQQARELQKTIQDLFHRLEISKESIHPYKEEVTKKIQMKIDGIRERYCETF